MEDAMRNVGWLPIALVSAGLLFFGGGVFELVAAYRFQAAAVSTVGTVVENVPKTQEDSSRNGTVETLYYPRIRFQTTSGREIFILREDVGTNPPSHKLGEAVTVLYDPRNPSAARIKSWWSLWGGPSMFLTGSAVYFTWPVIYFVKRRRQKTENRWLRQHGTRIGAVVMSIKKVRGQEKGKAYYRVVCLWTDPKTNRTFTFKSDVIPFDPTEYLTDRMIDVTIDPKQPSRYVVETEFLRSSLTPAQMKV
jgi:hypothetical protein